LKAASEAFKLGGDEPGDLQRRLYQIGSQYCGHPDYCTWWSPQCVAASSERKVAAYLPFAHLPYPWNEGTDRAGHGTHCAGSVAGHSVEPTVGGGDINDYQGMAPDARLVLVDNTVPTADGPRIVSPPGNETYAFDWALSLGAKVHSASWGGYVSHHTPFIHSLRTHHTTQLFPPNHLCGRVN